MSREIGKGISHEPHELGVELDRVDPRRAMIERQQDVGAAAGANDERLRSLQKMIRQRRRGVVEIGERFQLAVKGGDRAEASAIGEDAKLWRRLDGVAEAQTGGIAK